MKNMLLCALSLLGSTLFAHASKTEGAVPGEWTMDLEAAKKVAAEKQLPILLNFSGSDWCGWCELMESNVFEQPEWTAFSTNNLMMVLIDFPQDKSLVPAQFVERNEKLSLDYNVEGFPTFILLESDGTTPLGRLTAGEDKTPASFQQEIKMLLKDSVAAQKAYAAQLPEEARKTYEGLTAKLDVTKAAIVKEEQLMLKAEENLQDLNASLLEQQNALREFRVSQLSEAEQKVFAKLKTGFETDQAALMDWIQTNPEPTEENQKKFEAMRSNLENIALRLQAY